MKKIITMLILVIAFTTINAAHATNANVASNKAVKKAEVCKPTNIATTISNHGIIPSIPDVGQYVNFTITTTALTQKNIVVKVISKKAVIGYTDGSPGSIIVSNYSKDKAGIMMANFKDNPTAVKNVSSTTDKNTDVNNTNPAGYITENTKMPTNTATTTTADVPDKVSWI